MLVTATQQDRQSTDKTPMKLRQNFEKALIKHRQNPAGTPMKLEKGLSGCRCGIVTKGNYRAVLGKGRFNSRRIGE